MWKNTFQKCEKCEKCENSVKKVWKMWKHVGKQGNTLFNTFPNLN